ncbi:MAG: hypothetical protein AB1611_03585 [bacterium]
MDRSGKLGSPFFSLPNTLRITLYLSLSFMISMISLSGCAYRNLADPKYQSSPRSVNFQSRSSGSPSNAHHSPAQSGGILRGIWRSSDYTVFKKGKELYQKQRYEEARAKFLEITENYPNSSLTELAQNYITRIEEITGENDRPSTTGALPRADTPASQPASNTAGSSSSTPEKLLSNEFYDTDLREIIRNIATETGISLITDDTVQGFISVRYKNLPLEEVLKIILSAGGYTFRKMNGYYLIGSADSRSPLFNYLSRTEYVKPKFLKARELVKLISPSFASAIQVNEERNVLTITASPEMVERILADIRKVDTLPKQVRLEAIIVDLSSEAKKNLGIDWSGQSGKFSGSMQELGVTFGYLNSSSVVTDQITAKLQELVAKGQATLRATPHVTTMDGEEATINIGLEQYVSLTSGPVTYSYTTVQTIKAGITLNIIPFVSEDNTITVKIKPAEVSDFVETGANGLPLINKRSVTTTVVVNDQETITIGGFLKKREIDKITRVPILGYIPILNLIFSKKDKITEDSEVLILITPRIVNATFAAQG